ncbi:unnamed protein product [Sphenostylis stenocarpa]|uniref:Leucine-rich repeat-containing N-terminal plant-type domain-containing protein n=1 Tax=Sphenostylis stenocarpa TaxID=92480 RepID=A0AA86SDA5_9FABA|nr:unnamed protein product [Sphenostylis stenocarpa]
MVACREILCIESEGETLLKLKRHLKDPSNRLSSWNASAISRCCHWSGVLCSNITAHVSELHLNTSYVNFDGDYEAYTRSQFGGEINPCLVDLKHLNYLDLSGNDFESMPIPSFLPTMTSLTHLNLSYAGFMGNIPPQIGNLSNLLYLDLSSNSLFSENVDWLSRLSKLRYLDLSNNELLGAGTPIPTFLGTLTSLTHVDLSSAGFMGPIPPQIGNLSNLVYLDLSYVANGTIPSQIANLSNLLYLDLSGDLYAENIDWLSSLSKLEYLDLGGTNLSRSFHFFHILQTLPSLMHLHLSLCTLPLYNQPSLLNSSSLLTLDLSGISFSSQISFVPKWVFGLKKLVSLDLRYNFFKGSIPGGIRSLTLLENLDLSGNSFSSYIPDWFYGSFRHLTYLDLSYNNLQGTISDALGNMTSLVTLHLSGNQFDGPIPTSFGNLCNLREIYFSNLKLNQKVNEILEILSPCISHGLTTLEVRSSQLSGNLTNKLGDFKNIDTLDFYGNKIGGDLPRSLAKLLSLTFLILSENQFSGNPFESLGSLSKLSYLYIDHNRFQGVVKEDHFANLTRLKWFDASGNNLTLKVGPSWHPTFQLYRLDMSSWQLGPNFPSWIHSQNKLLSISMSNTGISDSIPSWFWKTFSQAEDLNLSYNHIHGELWTTLTNPISINVVDLSANNLNGKLPSLSNVVVSLDLSNNLFSKSMADFLCQNQDKPMGLELLNLASNNLSGEIPDCWMHWPDLVDVNLQSNNFVGNLPSSMGSLAELQSLHIRNNSLSGTFPTILKKTTKLIFLDLGENKFSGRIPSWVGESASNMKVLILRSNNFFGHIPNTICDMRLLQILDLAQNNLSGNIPTCFNRLNAITLTNKSSYLLIYCDTVNNTYLNGQLRIISVLLWLKGRGDEYRSILGLVTSIDLSNNQLVGEIPREITDLNGLTYLNLSHNQLIGHIPGSIGNMQSLLSIDFSRNQLCGEIPLTISNLSLLSMLDLSYNNLRGKIPTGTQLQTFDASNFIGNDLCGPPLAINCSSNNGIDSYDANGKGSDRHGVEWFFVSMTFGFVVGFWMVIGPLLICRSWRYAYFHFFDHVWFKLQSFFF